jgi:hypothetical protein
MSSFLANQTLFFYSFAYPGVATIFMILMSLLMQCFAILIMYNGDKKSMKRELIHVMTLTKGKSTLNLYQPLH